MSRSIRNNGESAPDAVAPVFAALGDGTRLQLLARLSEGDACSISKQTEGSGLTRQAITKHLRVLQKARVVRCVRSGRESLFAVDPEPLTEIRAYLERVSRQWDERLLRLKALVEE